MTAENLNEIVEFKRLHDLDSPTGTELELTLQRNTKTLVTIEEHLDTYDDPIEQKYVVSVNQETAYLFIEDLQVRLVMEDADGLPLGQKQTVVSIHQV